MQLKHPRVQVVIVAGGVLTNVVPQSTPFSLFCHCVLLDGEGLLVVISIECGGGSYMKYYNI